MRQITRTVSLLLTVGVIALSSCKRSDKGVVPSPQGNTYVGIALDFNSLSLRSTSDVTTNSKGQWSGKDKIESMTVYLANETQNSITKTDFQKADFRALTKEGKLFPKKAIPATAGEKVKVYVVINDFSAKLTTALNAITDNVANFEKVFDKAVAAVSADVAKSDSQKDIILMVNDARPTPLTVHPNISQQEAITGPGEAQNHIVVTVSRVVSRGLVTYIKNLSKEIPVRTSAGSEVADSKLTLESITYSLGQGNRQFFPIAPATDVLETPAPLYGYIPTALDFSTTGVGYMDNTLVSTFTDVKEIESNTSDKLTPILNANDGRYLLPVTHADGNYRKGNTSYADIKVTFKPAKVDGQPATSVKTVYLGLTDGLFYSTRGRAEAQNAAYATTSNSDDHAQDADVKQQAVEYKDGIMHYIVWLNPDKVPGAQAEKATKSPTVRNKVYNIIIKGFKEIGVPHNPLNPNDPDNPNNPDNPIKPDDPIQTDKTYLSTEIQVLGWTLNGYEVNLGNDY